MWVDLVIKVPENPIVTDETWIQENEAVAWEIQALQCEWPGHIMPQSQVVNSEKLVHCQINVSVEDPLILVSGLFLIYGLPWTILSMCSLYNTEPVYDTADPENAILLGYIAKEFLPIQPETLDFLINRPILDKNHVVIGNQEKQLKWISHFATEMKRIGE